MKQDIGDTQDVTFLVEKFYEQLLQHDSFKHIFNDVENFSWDTHIPVMVAFWENILFASDKYHGNPMTKHIQLHQRTTLTPELFKEWLTVWKATVNDNFEGNNADSAVKRAEQIAAVMEYKVLKHSL
jgi:hemoglobin